MPMREYNIAVLGSGGVDKSALVVQFIQGVFVEKYDPTIEDSYRKQIELDGEQIMLVVLDTAGTEQFTAMRDLYMKNSDGFILVYNVIHQSTFNDISDVHSRILAIKDTDTTPCVLVGNNCHLAEERMVSTEQGENLARKLNCTFLEASARLKINVDQVFYDLVRQIKRHESSYELVQKQRNLSMKKVMASHPQYKEWENSIPTNLKSVEEISDFCKKMDEGNEIRPTMKIIVLGNGRIGKSTLVNHLKHCNNFHGVKRIYQKIKDDPLKFVPLSTVGIDYSSIKVKKGKVSIFDFAGQLEYTVTHQYFLSSELIIYIVCFDLAQDTSEQLNQIKYWMDYLYSLLSTSNSDFDSKKKWRVVLVGTRSDKSSKPSAISNSSPVSKWQQTWPSLPLHPYIFITSQTDTPSIDVLMEFLTKECNEIMSQYSRRVPKVYLSLLEALKQQVKSKRHPFINIKSEFNNSSNMSTNDQQNGLKYLHAVGDIVMLPDELICTDPKYVSGLMSNFISPESVQMNLPHVTSKKVEVLTSEQVGKILLMRESDLKILDDLKVMSYFGICVPLPLVGNQMHSFLFPSLAKEAKEQLKFSIAPGSLFQFVGIKFSAPPKKVFVPGFFCKFLVDTFANQITEPDFVRVYSNGAIISCPSLSHGEIIIMLDPHNMSISVLMMATNPSLDFIIPVFQNLYFAFPQYANSTVQHLCPKCTEEWIVTLTRPATLVGTLPRLNADELCSTAKHINQLEIRPDPITALNVNKCWTHFKTNHDIFINYRVATEGRQAAHSKEPKQGMVELVYDLLIKRRKRNGDPVYVFWDFKCLNFGQNWEKGFLNALLSSKVIILLVTMKVMDGIAKNAENQQDNVLVEYECALLQNKLHGIPVIPLFLGDIEKENTDIKYVPFDFGKAKSMVPNKPHIRGASVQADIDRLRYIFKLQGCFLPNRGENDQELSTSLTTVITALERYLLKIFN